MKLLKLMAKMQPFVISMLEAGNRRNSAACILSHTTIADLLPPGYLLCHLTSVTTSYIVRCFVLNCSCGKPQNFGIATHLVVGRMDQWSIVNEQSPI